VQNLDSVPGLLELYLGEWYCNRSRLLAGIVHLENLQIFKYRTYCTDEIIAQLQQYCPHLTELDVTYSRKVTNASVEPLRAARKLKLLDLFETEIDDEHYGLLLSELPNVANITIWGKETSILRHIAVERLNTITHVTRYIVPETLVRHNRSITNNDSITVGVSGLSAFSALRVLKILEQDHTSSEIKTLLQGVGHRLTDLKLFGCWCVDIQDIVTLCPSLTDLSLIRCSFLSSHPQTPLDPQLTHFRNVINLKIGDSYIYPNAFPFIPYYVNVKTLKLMFVGYFDRFVTEILNLGTYKQLELLRVLQNRFHLITKEALQLLIGHCPLLKRIELVGTESNPEHYDLEELERQISIQNLNLKLKTSLYSLALC
jgi:hypothetical protein